MRCLGLARVGEGAYTGDKKINLGEGKELKREGGEIIVRERGTGNDVV
jgi:hypothetical protein